MSTACGFRIVIAGTMAIALILIMAVLLTAL
jgi:hypothetical protein